MTPLSRRPLTLPPVFWLNETQCYCCIVLLKPPTHTLSLTFHLQLDYFSLHLDPISSPVLDPEGSKHLENNIKYKRSYDHTRCLQQCCQGSFDQRHNLTFMFFYLMFYVSFCLIWFTCNIAFNFTHETGNRLLGGKSALCCCCFSWVNYKKEEQHSTVHLSCQHVPLLLLFISHPKFLLHSSGVSAEMLRHVVATTPEFLSHLSVHCECVSMSFWNVCECVCVFICVW